MLIVSSCTVLEFWTSIFAFQEEESFFLGKLSLVSGSNTVAKSGEVTDFRKKSVETAASNGSTSQTL